MILPFGKHRGKSLCEVPRQYLSWLDAQTWFAESYPRLAEAVTRSLSGGDDESQTTALATDVLKVWRRTILARFHPDRPGGSHAAFLAVTDAIESLASMLAKKGVSA